MIPSSQIFDTFKSPNFKHLHRLVNDCNAEFQGQIESYYHYVDTIPTISIIINFDADSDYHQFSKRYYIMKQEFF